MNKEIYNKLSIINVKNKLNLKEVYYNGNSIYTYCPFCKSENRLKANLRLNVINDSYYCNFCGENGYAVGLYAKQNYITNKVAFKQLLKQDFDMTTNFKGVHNALRKSDEEISIVYEYFLKILGLTKKHCKNLLELGFSKEEILKSSFRSVPQNEKEKIEICNRLLKCGFDLLGVPGFFINEQMKWTFKSHDGFFIPVIYDGHIKGLRIHLDKEYKLNTTDIWFSSGSEYQGSNAKNSIMIFIPENENTLTLYNSNKIEKDIIITSEFLLGYRLFLSDNKITISIPNRISKKQGQKILNNIKIGNANVYIDKHTISYDYLPIYKNLLNHIQEDKKNIKFIFDFNELKSNKEDINNMLGVA